MAMIREIEKELGFEEALATEGSRVTIRVDARRYGKNMTIIDGFDPAVDLPALTKELKNHLGAGGTLKDGAIEIQGDHRREARAYLERKGFPVV